MGLFKKLLNDVSENMKEALEQTKNELQASINDKRNEIEQSLSSRLNGFTSKVDSQQKFVKKTRVENKSTDSIEEKNEIIETEYGTIKNGVLVINEGIKEIKERSLSKYKTIKKVVFPTSLIKLNSFTLEDMPKLEELDFSKVNKLKSIPGSFVFGNNRISHFSIPYGVEKVGNYVLGDKGNERIEIFVPSTVQEMKSISGFENTIVYWLFTSDLADIDWLAQEAKILNVLEKDLSKYKKQLVQYDDELGTSYRYIPVRIIDGRTLEKYANMIGPNQEETDMSESYENAEPNNTEANIEERKNSKDNAMIDGNVEKESSSIEDENIVFSPRLEALIKSAFKDGVLTQKEKEILLRRAEKEGEDPDEFEMLLNERIEKMGIEVIEDAPENASQKSESITSEATKERPSKGKKGLFSDKLLFLIDNALEDGELTDQEKNAIIKRAQADGEDIDEVDIYIQSLQQKRQKELQEKAQKTAAKEMETRAKAQEARAKADQEEEKERATILRECPACGCSIPHMSNVCPECGHVIRTSDNDKEIMDLIQAYIISKERRQRFVQKDAYDNDPVLKKAYIIVEYSNKYDSYMLESNENRLKVVLETLYGDNPKVKKILGLK